MLIIPQKEEREREKRCSVEDEITTIYILLVITQQPAELQKSMA